MEPASGTDTVSAGHALCLSLFKQYGTENQCQQVLEQARGPRAFTARTAVKPAIVTFMLKLLDIGNAAPELIANKSAFGEYTFHSARMTLRTWVQAMF
jgi:hypothetical protein